MVVRVNGLPVLTGHWEALRGRRVLARVDLNVDHAEDGGWLQDLRVAQVVRLARRLSALGCIVILASHYGRPEGCPLATHSMAHIPAILTRLFRLPVTFVPSLAAADEALGRARPGAILLLENLRFHPEEQAGDVGFARRLASLADCYVHEAFASSHRAHASLAHLPSLLPAYAGPGLARESARVGALLRRMRPPLAVLAGGGKVDKLDLYIDISWVADALLLGSGFASALVRQPRVLEALSPAAVAPVDLYVRGPRGVDLVALEELRPDTQVLDVGPRTLRTYCERLGGARTIVCNGAMGILAASDARSSSGALSRALDESLAVKIACGGTGASVYRGAQHKFSGGGAVLARLAEKLRRVEPMRRSS